MNISLPVESKPSKTPEEIIELMQRKTAKVILDAVQAKNVLDPELRRLILDTIGDLARTLRCIR